MKSAKEMGQIVAPTSYMVIPESQVIGFLFHDIVYDYVQYLWLNSTISGWAPHWIVFLVS